MSKETSPVIQLRDVSRRFKDEWALSDVGLDVEAGEIHALLGPNGAGKTTLMKIVAGLTSVTSGSVVVLGGSPDERALRSRMGWVPSTDRSFYLRLSGRENLLFFARMYGMDGRSGRSRSDELLEAVGLAADARKRAGLYSHGMLKRLAVARSLLARPEILLLDEATHDLDPLGTNEVRALVADLARDGVTVLWATQRLVELRGFAHRTTVLKQGTVRFSGPVGVLSRTAPHRSFRLRFDTDAPDATALSSQDIKLEPEEEVGSVLLHLAEGQTLGHALADLDRAGYALLSCSEVTSDIEAAFLHIVDDEMADP